MKRHWELSSGVKSGFIMNNFAHKRGKSVQIQELRDLLDELRSAAALLVQRNNELVQENSRLKKENEKIKDQLAVREAEPVLTQKERLILKQQLARMIRRLDRHLEEKA